jgi:mycothiol synthase
MTIDLRSFSGEADKQRMSALIHTSIQGNLHVMDLPYRLSSWAFDYPENVGLWVDETGKLVAWAVLQTPMWALDYAHLPTVDESDMMARIMDWADAHAHIILNTPSGHPAWFVNIREGHHDCIKALEQAGFTCQGNVAKNPWSKVLLQRSAQSRQSYPSLPEGYSIRPFAGEREIDAYVELHRSVFGSPNMTHAWRHRVLHRPEYIPELDLVATAPDGRLAAFCICWFDAAGLEGRPCGQIEPLGVQDDLGRAILSEALQRLHHHGAERVYVETDVYRDAAFATYQSIGFRVAYNILVFRKDYGDH